MKQPSGFEQRGNEQRVCRLNKAIYGLKQSGRIWFETYLIKINFKHLGSDKCIFTFDTQNGSLILAFYVDDMLIISSNEYVLNESISIIKNQFKLKKSKKNENKTGRNFVSMNQTRYIDTMLEHFGMKDSNPSSVPLDPNQDLDRIDSSGKYDQKRYQELLGSLMYLGTKPRPDIAFQLSTLSRFSKDPSQIHMGALKRILRYLKGTKHSSLEYNKDIPELRAYSDANWKEISTAVVKSTTGISYLLGNISCHGLLDHRRNEINALTECVKKCIYIQCLCEELFNILGSRIRPIIFFDNKSAIFLAQNGHVSNRSNHLVRKVAFIA
ncbi:hypothetical protein LAZ67_1007098 [Cordylochernes scorpioides]|uniref:Reverse transcriptase Ty1/copia-type domain-containing protein n=1 Tax=Cordylochernes scorpioides TaxID=51811 RepID=A0ABY6JZ25_9ARAC|nr:hypothetical protein LAZ67_1007098 [Cordylochernes scorpioides]